MTRKSYGLPAKSAIRALLILEYFETKQCPLSLKAIAEHFELAASSASALLKNLASLDYLSYDSSSRTYLPTLRLANLGSWVERRIIEQGLDSLVQRLQVSTGETVVITMLNDLYIDFVYFRSDEFYDEMYPGSGGIRFPRGGAALTCPFSWCLLRSYSNSRLENIYYRSKMKSIFDSSLLSCSEFQSHVEVARSSKYVLVKPWPYPDSAVLATTLPVLPFGRRVALGIGAMMGRMQEKLPMLLDAIDSELSALVSGTGLGRDESDVYDRRFAEIELKFALFESPDSIPDYSPAHGAPAA